MGERKHKERKRQKRSKQFAVPVSKTIVSHPPRQMIFKNIKAFVAACSISGFFFLKKKEKKEERRKKRKKKREKKTIPSTTDHSRRALRSGSTNSSSMAPHSPGFALHAPASRTPPAREPGKTPISRGPRRHSTCCVPRVAREDTKQPRPQPP